jgi:hypothetical protein
MADFRENDFLRSYQGLIVAHSSFDVGRSMFGVHLNRFRGFIKKGGEGGFY